ncbi:MAG: sulfatase [Bacteroidota bacterium]
MKKIILFLSLCCLIACQDSSTHEQADVSPPNILFIMSDDHTSQAWGVYGGILDSFIDNPHIRRLRDEGTLLRNAFCTNSICTPSRATILTGQYSHLNGVYTLSEALEPETDHVVKHLRRGGYETAIIGKWHLKKRPTGFDYYNVLPGQGRYNDPILKDSLNWEEGGEVYPGFSSDVIGDLSVQWLEKRNAQQPFFLMTHFKATHEPFDFPERYDSMYAGIEIPEPLSLAEFGQRSSGRTFSGQVLEILKERYKGNTSGRYPEPYGEAFDLRGLDSLEARRKVYQKFLKDFLRSGKAIDDNIGKILTWLDEKGLADNTVVIYTADQGYFLGEHGFFDKRMMYEEALRMPFIIRYPKEISAQGELTDMVLNIDFASLFLDYAGLETPGWMQGRSFRQNLRGDTPEDWRSHMYYRYWLHQRQRPSHLGIRTDRYKLIYYYGLPLGLPGTHPERTAPAWEFYDLQEDPYEDRNAYTDPQYMEVIAKLKQALATQKSQMEDLDAEHPEVLSLLEQEGLIPNN